MEQRWNEHTPMHLLLSSRSDNLHHTGMLLDFSSQMETEEKLHHLANQDYTQLMERGCFLPFPIILVDSN